MKVKEELKNKTIYNIYNFGLGIQRGLIKLNKSYYKKRCKKYLNFFQY